MFEYVQIATQPITYERVAYTAAAIKTATAIATVILFHCFTLDKCVNSFLSFPSLPFLSLLFFLLPHLPLSVPLCFVLLCSLPRFHFPPAPPSPFRLRQGRRRHQNTTPLIPPSVPRTMLRPRPRCKPSKVRRWQLVVRRRRQ